MDSTDGLDELREILIWAIHSKKEAQASLLARISEPSFAAELAQVCFPYDHYSNDPRMSAAYYLSLCPVDRLLEVAPTIEQLLRLPFDGDTMNDNIGGPLLDCMSRLIAEAGFVPSPETARLLEERTS